MQITKSEFAMLSIHCSWRVCEVIVSNGIDLTQHCPMRDTEKKPVSPLSQFNLIQSPSKGDFNTLSC